MDVRQTGDTAIPAARLRPAHPHPAAVHPRVLDSSSLLDGQREIRIRHGGDTYRLRHTRNDKLILTK